MSGVSSVRLSPRKWPGHPLMGTSNGRPQRSARGFDLQTSTIGQSDNRRLLFAVQKGDREVFNWAWRGAIVAARVQDSYCRALC
jgi:hypothetical protein